MTAYALDGRNRVVFVLPAHGIAYLLTGEVAHLGDAIVPGTPQVREVSEDGTSGGQGGTVFIGGVDRRNFRVLGFDNTPAVLKRPRAPRVGEVVIKSGAETGITRGEVLQVDYADRIRYEGHGVAEFADLIRTTPMGKFGDSGALLLSDSGLEPLGQLIAVSGNMTVYGKVTNVVERLNLQGIFCPLSLPASCPRLLVNISESLILDGCWEQLRDLSAGDPSAILGRLGVQEDVRETAIGRHSVRGLRREGNRDAGRPIFHRDTGDLLGVVTASQGNTTFVTPVEKLCDAFALRPLPTIRTVS